MENEKELEFQYDDKTVRVISCELITSDVTLIGGSVIIMNEGPTKEDVIH